MAVRVASEILGGHKLVLQYRPRKNRTVNIMMGWDGTHQVTDGVCGDWPTLINSTKYKYVIREENIRTRNY